MPIRERAAAGEKTKLVFISAGDSSGDLHAANLMKEMRRRCSALSFAGFGLDRMLAAGLENLDTRPAPAGAMWLHNLLNIERFRKRLEIAQEFFRKERPGLVIMVDYGGFNLFLAKAATQAQIPVLYYILPQAWAHGRYRLKKIRKWTTRAAVIYPFEPEICRRYGVDAQYVGHPLFDELKAHPPHYSSVREIAERYGEKMVAIFPGSRSQEIRANLPVILKACGSLRDRHEGLGLVAACPRPVRDVAAGIIRKYPIKVALSDRRPVELARAAALCITKSGTITLEIASQYTPMVILYRTSFFLHFIISGMTHTPYAGIVNVLAGKKICPEKVMWRSDPKWLFSRADRLLKDEELQRKHSSELRKLADRIGSPGATKRTADIAIDMMGTKSAHKRLIIQEGLRTDE